MPANATISARDLLFAVGGVDTVKAVVLAPADIPVLQEFFDRNPLYFQMVDGRPPRANEAECEFNDLPPPDMPYAERLLIGFVDGHGEMLGMAGVLGDFLAEHIWHIGIFVVATSLHGSGVAHAMYAGLESWMRGKRARWVRLGVVEGNTRAENFWESKGYIEVRKREGVAMGNLVNTLRVMVKTFDDATVDGYLAVVARDRPEPSTDTGLHKASVQLVRPAECHLASYVDALRRGWSADNVRPEVAREHLDRIEQDAAAFLRSLVDREASGGPVTLPDGSTVPRLPGYVHWMWDGEFCGSINFRWQPGTTALPPHCLGHIGYAVVPWKRGRGYATLALKSILLEAKAEGLPFVEITTDPTNLASQRVIEANGGVLFERFTKPAQYGGVAGLRYRIALE